MRLAIVEDNIQLLENLRLLLDGENDISVVGTYESAEAALEQLVSAEPEVMLTDIGLPKLSGIELIGRIKKQLPDLDIMAYTVLADRKTIFDALRAGACGYITKGATPRELVEALYDLHRGGSPMSPKIARSVIQAFQDNGVPDDRYLLSPRELNVLSEIEKGQSYKEIARTLSISANTVHSHIKKIYGKLHSKNRGEALSSAHKKGIL